MGYFPKPGSVGIRICHHQRIQPRSQVNVIFRYLRPEVPISTSTIYTEPVGMVTFWQSPCWYYPWADAAVSIATDTQHLWTWWHFGDHAGLINLSVNNIRRIHSTCWHGDISAITLLILSLSGCCCLNSHWYTAPVDMMIFRWSRRFYQSICQQHPPYSYRQITLIYYTSIYFRRKFR